MEYVEFPPGVHWEIPTEPELHPIHCLICVNPAIITADGNRPDNISLFEELCKILKFPMHNFAEELLVSNYEFCSECSSRVLNCLQVVQEISDLQEELEKMQNDLKEVIDTSYKGRNNIGGGKIHEKQQLVRKTFVQCWSDCYVRVPELNIPRTIMTRRQTKKQTEIIVSAPVKKNVNENIEKIQDPIEEADFELHQPPTPILEDGSLGDASASKEEKRPLQRAKRGRKRKQETPVAVVQDKNPASSNADTKPEVEKRSLRKARRGRACKRQTPEVHVQDSKRGSSTADPKREEKRPRPRTRKLYRGKPTPPSWLRRLQNPYKPSEYSSVRKRHKCAKCGKGYASFTLCQAHELTCNLMESRIPCDYCDMKFFAQKHLYLHCRKFHKESVQKMNYINESSSDTHCPYCQLEFPTDPPPFELDDDDYETHLHYGRLERDRRIHITHCSKNPRVIARTLPEGSLFKCEHCTTGYKTYTALQNHVASVHEKSFKLCCDQCGEGFNVHNALRRHMERKHLGIRRFPCELCPKTYVQRSALAVHMRSHTGETPFMCEACGKGFKSNCKLKRHVLTHSGEKPFKCHICGRGFASKHYLSNHLRISTHERILKKGRPAPSPSGDEQQETQQQLPPAPPTQAFTSTLLPSVVVPVNPVPGPSILHPDPWGMSGPLYPLPEIQFHNM